MRATEPDCAVGDVCTCVEGFVLENDVCVHGKVNVYVKAVHAYTHKQQEREREGGEGGWGWGGGGVAHLSACTSR